MVTADTPMRQIHELITAVWPPGTGINELG